MNQEDRSRALGPGNTWQIPEIVWGGGGAELTGFDDSPGSQGRRGKSRMTQVSDLSNWEASGWCPVLQ